MSALYPMLVEPRYVQRIWGGHHLAELLGKAAPRDQPIGESWEVYEGNRVSNGAHAGRTIGELRLEMGVDLMGHVPSGELFPLLTKLIDAQDVLSVQVHPDDHFAHELEGQPYGKTECWYVIHAEPTARLTYGFLRDTTPQEYTDLVQEGRLEDILRQLPVHAGDVIYLPAGMVHAIGAGIIVYELQQTSDVTYRIYDWNRHDSAGNARELHIDKARRVLDYHRCARATIVPLSDPDGARTMLIGSRYFCMELVNVGACESLSTYNSVVAVCSLDSPLLASIDGEQETVELAPYTSMLIPAAAARYSLRPRLEEEGRALIAYVPASVEDVRQNLLERGFSASAVSDFLEQFVPVI